MWPSELARQLKVNPGVISKRLSVYRSEAGLERHDTLDEQTIRHMTEINQLLGAHATMTVREATLRVLGQWIEPVTAQEAHLLRQHLLDVQARLSEVERMLNDVHGVAMSREQRRRETAGHDPLTPEWAAILSERVQPAGDGQG